MRGRPSSVPREGEFSLNKPLILNELDVKNKEQRNPDYNTHRNSVTSSSAQDAITLLYLFIANGLLLY